MHKGHNNNQIENKIVPTVEQTIIAYRMFQPGDSVLVGVSGGPDSVALLHVLLIIAPRFSLRLGVAHLNHCLRQEDSDNDAEFVASLAEKLNLPYYIKREDVRKYQLENKLSLEEAARRIRHTFYDQAAEKNRFNKIALGHHSDDNAELVLMYIFRGSGLLGISGIPPVRDTQNRNIQIVRPFIKLSKSEIIDFLTTKELNYVSDRTNKETRYLRNRIRHYLIPTLKKSYNPRIIETLGRLAAIVGSEEEWIEDVIHPIYEKAVLDIQDDKVTLSIESLGGIHVAAKRRVIRKAIAKVKGDLRRVTFSHIDSAISLLDKGPACWSLDLPNRIRIKRNGDVLLFSKEKGALRGIDVNIGNGETVSFEYKIPKPTTLFIKEIGAHLKLSEIGVEKLPDFSNIGHQAAFFDINALSFPLTLRNFRPGDRFKPLGMTGTQKVKKYFINKKVLKTKRERCPILLSRDKIVWVVGHRIDESVKVIPSTKKALKGELSQFI